MTFYEAALRVLESAGTPLHVVEITEKAIQQSLLSHVGKTPEQTMLSRLAAMARRPRDRKVIVTAKDTFGLADWAIPEDPEALAQTGVPEPHPEEELPPLRPAERHPEPRADIVRVAGRGERKRRHEEEDRGKRRRFPPLPDVAFEVLSDASGPLAPEGLIERARAKELASEELGRDQLLLALLEENQRRIDAGRRPQFTFDKESSQLALEPSGSEVPPSEIQAAFAAALGLAMENGRPVLPRAAERTAESAAELAAAQSAKAAIKEARRAMARVFRRRLAELDVGTFEKSVVRMMQGLGFRELKVAKRSKEGPLLTARRREGSVELRYAVRVLRGASAVDRRAVQELRRDLGHYSAQIGLLASPADVRGEAKGEAQSSGPLVLLWCGEALAEKFFEARAGVQVQQVELYEIDDRFFEQARIDAEDARARREERLKEKAQRAEAAPELAPVPAVASAGVEPVEATATEAPWGVEEEGGEEEGEETAEAAPAGEGQPGQPGAPAQGEGKRRRRRRRGRRGRGHRPGEAQPVGGAPTAESSAAPEPSAAPEAAAAPPPSLAGSGTGE